MRFSVVASVLLHGCVLGLAFVSLPESWRTHVEPEPIIPVSLIREAELAPKTSIPAAAPKPIEPKPEPEQPAPEEIKPEPKPEPKPEVKPEPLPAPKPEPKPEPVKPEPKPEVKPEPPKEKPKPKPKPKEEELDLDALSELVDKARDKQKPSGAPAEAPVTADKPRAQVGAGDRLSASAEAKMQAAIARCWQTSALIGAPEPEKLVVRLEIRLNRDGTLLNQPRTMNSMEINLSGNRFWKSAEQIAQRAVISCQPYDFLPQESYETWKEMELNFDPSVMAGF